MIEIPEGITLAKQLDKELKNKKIVDLVADSSHHSFAWYNGDPKEYTKNFTGKVVGCLLLWREAASAAK